MDTLCADLLNLIVPFLKTSELHCLRLNEPDSSAYTKLIKTSSKFRLAFNNHDYHYILESPDGLDKSNNLYKLLLAIEFNFESLIRYYFNIFEVYLQSNTNNNISIVPDISTIQYPITTINRKYITYLLIVMYQQNKVNLIERINNLLPKLGPHTANSTIAYWLGYHSKEETINNINYFQGLLDGKHYDLFKKIWTKSTVRKFISICTLISTIEDENLATQLLYDCAPNCIIKEENHGKYFDIFLSKSRFKVVEMLLKMIKPTPANIVKIFRAKKSEIIPDQYFIGSLDAIKSIVRFYASNNQLEQIDHIFDIVLVRDHIIQILWSEFKQHYDYTFQKVIQYYGSDVDVGILNSLYPPTKTVSNEPEASTTSNNSFDQAVDNKDYQIIGSKDFCRQVANSGRLMRKVLDTDCLDTLKVLMIAMIKFGYMDFGEPKSYSSAEYIYVQNIYKYHNMTITNLRKESKKIGVKAAYKKNKINILVEIAELLH